MTNTTVTTGTPVAPRSLPARFVGVIVSPKDTFTAVAAHPKWFGMLALVTLALAGLIGGFLATPEGQAAWLERASAGANDQQYESMLKISKYLGYMGAVQMLVMVPLIGLVISGILFGVFNTLGGDATFRQTFAVVIHSNVISVLGQLFTVPLNYSQGRMASATNLAVMLPMLDEKSFAGRLAAMIDLFLVWWVLVLAIGLGVLYRRRTQPIALGLFGVYAVIALVAAFVMSRLGAA